MSHDLTCPRRSGIGPCWCVPTVDRVVDKARLAGQIAEPRRITAAGGEVVGARDLDARDQQFDPAVAEADRREVRRLIAGYAELDRKLTLVLALLESQFRGVVVADVTVPPVVS